MNYEEIEALVIWKQQVQEKKKTFEGCLNKMKANKSLYDQVNHYKLKFWLNSLSHELFLIESLLDTELKSIDLSEIKTIINYDI